MTVCITATTNRFQSFHRAAILAISASAVFCVAAYSQIACPGTTSDIRAGESCSVDLPGGMTHTKNCATGNGVICTTGAIITCCTIFDDNMVPLAAACLCVTAPGGGGCDPAQLGICDPGGEL